MKFQIPFYMQSHGLDCGALSLKMALVYLSNKDISLEEIKKKAEIKEGKATLTIELAIAAKLFGFDAIIFSKYASFNQENRDLEFYKKYLDESKELNTLSEKAKELGINIIEKTLTLDEILNFLKEDSIPIVLLDWNIIKWEGAEEKEEKTYQGHFVPITGYDSENIYVHNPGPRNATPYFAIKRDLFDKARKAQGTDEDVLIISILKPKHL